MRKLLSASLAVFGLAALLGHGAVGEIPWSTFVFNAPDRVTVTGTERIGISVGVGSGEYVTPDELQTYFLSLSNAFLGANSFAGVTTFTGSIAVPVRTVTASGAITLSATTDYFVCVNKSAGAATTVNLPAPASATNKTFLVKDCKGDGATNNITLTPASGTIDGASTFVLNANYQSIGIVSNGSAWFTN